MSKNNTDPVQTIKAFAQAMGMGVAELETLRQIVDKEEEYSYTSPSTRMAWLNPVEELTETGEVIEEPVKEKKPIPIDKKALSVFGGFIVEPSPLGSVQKMAFYGSNPVYKEPDVVPVEPKDPTDSISNQSIDIADEKPTRRMRFD